MRKQEEYRFLFGDIKSSMFIMEMTLKKFSEFRNILGNQYKNGFIISEKGTAECYCLEKECEFNSEKGKKLFNKNFSAKLFKNSKEARETYQKFVKKLPLEKEVKKYSNKELWGLFKEWFWHIEKLLAYFCPSRPEVLKYPEQKLRELLIKKLGKIKKVDKYFIILTTPALLDEIKKEKIDLIEIVLRKKEKPNFDTKAALVKHARKHPWLFWFTFNNRKAIQFLEERIKYFIEQKPRVLRKELKDIKKEIVKLKKQQKKVLKKLKYDKKIIYLAWLLKKSTQERLSVKSAWGGGEFTGLSFLSEIAKRIGISITDFFITFRYEDVRNFLERGKRIEKREIERRKNIYILWLKDGKLKFYCGKLALRVKNKDLRYVFEIKDTKELKGQIANTGVVQGRARLVSIGNISEIQNAIKNFKKGEVLITGMTQPNMVRIVKKASAIVTDEGGITSHAAIISREFKIPCIVGTRIATKVLKDKDLVEVDANRGVVKILK